MTSSNPMTPLELIQFGEDYARRVYFEHPPHRDLMPIFHIECSPKPLIIGAPWQSESEKYATIARIKSLATEHNATAVMFISECWMSLAIPHLSLSDLSLIDPSSQRPNRQEGLQILVKSPSGTLFKSFTIHRDPTTQYVTSLTPITPDPTDQIEANILHGLFDSSPSTHPTPTSK